MEQRFPTPLRQDVLGAARRRSASTRRYVYGLIRQESRFIMDARSGVGACGLMQLMPATARWTAKKIGMPYTPALITDRDTNLRLGNAYLKLVLDDVGGSQADGRRRLQRRPRPAAQVARRARCSSRAIWAENIPFTGDARLRQEGAQQRGLLRHALLGGQAHDRALAPRPAGRPARSERAVDRQRAALRAGAGLGENRRWRPARFHLFRHASQFPDPRRHRLRRPQRRRKLVERGGGAGGADPHRHAPRGRAPSRCSCCRRSRWRWATSTTRRRWRGCCAAPTR